MGLIQSFTPGSIRTVGDMSRALQIVFADTFHDVLSISATAEDQIDFYVDNGDSLVITIRTAEEIRAEGEKSLREVIGLEWPTWETVQKLGTDEANRRLAHRAPTEDERYISWIMTCMGIEKGRATRLLMGMESGASDDHVLLLEEFTRSGLSLGVVIRAMHDKAGIGEVCTDDELALLDAWHKTGLPLDEAIAKMEMPHIDDPDDDDQGDTPSAVARVGLSVDSED